MRASRFSAGRPHLSHALGTKELRQQISSQRSSLTCTSQAPAGSKVGSVQQLNRDWLGSDVAQVAERGSAGVIILFRASANKNLRGGVGFGRSFQRLYCSQQQLHWISSTALHLLVRLIFVSHVHVYKVYITATIEDVSSYPTFSNSCVQFRPAEKLT